MFQYLLMVRHALARDDLPRARAEATSLPGIINLTLEHDVPVVEAALEDYRGLVQALWQDQQIANALTRSPIDVHCSTKWRAYQSENVFRQFMVEGNKGKVWLGRLNPAAELDGRNYGFTWHRTLAGIEQQFSEEYARFLQEGEFDYRPRGGESWADKAASVAPFLNRIFAKSRKHQIFITHEEIIPLIETMLSRFPLTAQNVKARRRRINNATAVVYRRLYTPAEGAIREWVGKWDPYRVFAPASQKDYSGEPDAAEWLSIASLPGQIVYLDNHLDDHAREQVRERLRKREAS
jgi:broad specificity phosphatase PhoE